MPSLTRFVALVLLAFQSFPLSADGPPSLPPEGLPAPPPLPENLLRNQPEGPPPELPDPSELVAQLKQLGELLAMSPEKLRNLRQTIEFIEKMPPQAREAMRIRLAQVTQLNAGLEREIAELTTVVPELPSSDVSQFWLASSEQEREALRTQLEALSPAQKAKVLSSRIQAFLKKRDDAFARMRESLEARRRAHQGGD